MAKGGSSLYPLYGHTAFTCKAADQTSGHIKWAVSMVILHMVTSIFLRGLSQYIWVNILTLSPQMGAIWWMVVNFAKHPEL